MPSSIGGWGSTPLWAITGRVPSLRSSARFTDRSSTDLFHVGSSWREQGAGPRPPRRCHRRRAPSTENGSSWPHHIDDRRVVGEQVDRLPRLAHGLLADAAGVATVQREVLPHEHPGPVGGVVQLGPADVGVDPDEVEAGVLGQRRRRRRSPRPLASARAWRVGARLAPLRNRRSPLTRSTQPSSDTCRRPTRARAAMAHGRRPAGGRRPRPRGAAGRRACGATTAGARGR